MLGETLDVAGGEVVGRGVRMAGVAPDHQVGLAAEALQGVGVPLDHHVVPQQRPNALAVQLVQQRLDVMKIKGALAVCGHVGFGVGVGAERPGFVAAEMEVPHLRRQGQHVANHGRQQLPRARRQRVQHAATVRDLPQMRVIRNGQRRFHVAEALDQGNDLDGPLSGGRVERPQLLGRVGGLAAEPLIHRPGEAVFPLDHHGVVAAGGDDVQKLDEPLGRGRHALEIQMHATDRRDGLLA